LVLARCGLRVFARVRAARGLLATGRVRVRFSAGTGFLPSGLLLLAALFAAGRCACVWLLRKRGSRERERTADQ
jgi:hypothetical protein